VSVRSVDEAEAAMNGGAALIDVKEPSRGSLGRADNETLDGVLRYVAGRRPMSAALGELVERFELPALKGLRFIKWGLSGCPEEHWRRDLEAVSDKLRQLNPECNPVAVGYADWQRARSPSPNKVAEFAVENSWPVFLLDTWMKDGSSLFDWLSAAAVCDLTRLCRTAGVRVALAGSLGLDHLFALRELQPDWLAVRGAVCRHGKRNEAIDPVRVARLVKALANLSLIPANSAD
jgi:uncharacterized protein (UPF0264 family)